MYRDRTGSARSGLVYARTRQRGGFYADSRSMQTFIAWQIPEYAKPALFDPAGYFRLAATGMLLLAAIQPRGRPSAHRNELFSRSRVNSHAVIKIGLSRAHFDGNSKTLQHFVGGVANHVQAHHFLLGAGAD